MSAKNNNDNQNCGYPQCPIEFLTELLEKLVEAQLAQSEKMTLLNKTLSDNGTKIDWIKSQFTNGFRSEMKTHITDAIEQHHGESDVKHDILIEDVQALNDKISVYQQPQFWAKVLIALMVATTAMVMTAHSLYDAWHDHLSRQQQSQIQIDSKKYDAIADPHAIIKEEGDKHGRNPSTRTGQ